MWIIVLLFVILYSDSPHFSNAIGPSNITQSSNASQSAIASTATNKEHFLTNLTSNASNLSFKLNGSQDAMEHFLSKNNLSSLVSILNIIYFTQNQNHQFSLVFVNSYYSIESRLGSTKCRTKYDI